MANSLDKFLFADSLNLAIEAKNEVVIAQIDQSIDLLKTVKATASGMPSKLAIWKRIAQLRDERAALVTQTWQHLRAETCKIDTN